MTGRLPTFSVPLGLTSDEARALSAEIKRYSDTLGRVLEQRETDRVQGNTDSIFISQVQNGTLMKGFTTVASTPYYLKQGDGTLLIDTSVLGAVEIVLTSAIINSDKTICVKKVDNSGNSVTISAMDSALIDGSANHVFTTSTGSRIVSCDSKNWWVLSGE